MTIEDSKFTRVGICGFCLSQAELFAKFRYLEVQQTFYWPPQLKTVERWRRTAPAHFEFTLKAFQAITHAYNHRTYRKARFGAEELAQCGGFRDTPVVRSAWQLTHALAVALESKFVVFQCPPSFIATDENVGNVRAFFNWATRGTLRFAWEPRHESWTRDLVAILCRELDLIHAVDPFEQACATGEPRYYRLHGTALGGYRYDYNHIYTDSEFATLQQLCAGAATYCMFNNKQMATDASRFERAIAGGEAAIATSVQG
jgi:uncharacterized protein YecE (DUF72 family)